MVKAASPATHAQLRPCLANPSLKYKGQFFSKVLFGIVENYRTDPLTVGYSSRNQDSLNDLSERTLPDIMRAAIKGTNDALHEDGRPTTDILLPGIDTHILGQLFQMLMIATVVEGRLLGVNPYGQPGVEQYKQNMNKNLGRG